MAACLNSAREEGYIVPPEYILQEQASGADSDRPLLAWLRQLVREGKLDAIFIYHPDRLSRDATDLMVLWEEITEQGVEIRLLQGPAGTSPQDKLLRFIFGYKSEAERRDILERTLRGKKKTAEKGQVTCGVPVWAYSDTATNGPVTGVVASQNWSAERSCQTKRPWYAKYSTCVSLASAIMKSPGD